MKLILALMAVVVLTGCSSTQVRTGCIWDCDKWAQWEKEAEQKKSEETARWAKQEEESKTRIAKWEAEAKSLLAKRKEEENRLETKCATYSKEDRVLTTKERTTMETAVKDVLKDPWSAQFRKTSKVSAWMECRRGIIYMGEVNAKNSYGGYGGFKTFSVGNSGVDISSY